MKRQANKKIRNSDIGEGMNYKKHFNSWDICDGSYMLTCFSEPREYYKAVSK
jgi:hypothetical protein